MKCKIIFKIKTMSGSWIRCLSIMGMGIWGNHLRQQLCRTCRRRPGTCAAPRWASPSSGRLPSYLTSTSKHGSSLASAWSDQRPTYCQLRSLASEAAWLDRPQPYACHCLEAKPDFRLNYSDPNPSLALTLDLIFFMPCYSKDGAFSMGKGKIDMLMPIASWHISLLLDSAFCNPPAPKKSN